jgi:hypothetical protein
MYDYSVQNRCWHSEYFPQYNCSVSSCVTTLIAVKSLLRFHNWHVLQFPSGVKGIVKNLDNTEFNMG